MYAFTPRADQLAALKRFLNANDPLMLVIGAAGSGKTNLINQLIADTQVTQRLIRLQGAQNLPPAQLTLSLARQCDLRIDNDAESYRRQLDAMAHALAARARAYMLIVDDADCLPLATLAALSHLASTQEPHHIYLHIILWGKPALLEKAGTLQTNAFPYLQLKPTLQPIVNQSVWQRHWIKSVSLMALLLIGFSLWHYNHRQFHSRNATPITLTTDVHFVSATPRQTPALAKKQPRYILQLMGSRHLNALEHFIANNNLQGKAYIMTAVYQGKAWYILAYGKYASLTSAKTAQRQLPPLLKKLQPWVRPMTTTARDNAITKMPPVMTTPLQTHKTDAVK